MQAILTWLLLRHLNSYLVFIIQNLGATEALALGSANDVSSIKEAIQSFFTQYEKAYDDGGTIYYEEYFAIDKGEVVTTNVELIDMLLYRRIKTRELAPCDIREIDKSFDFEYLSMSFEQNKALVCLNVTKEFHYMQTPDIDSAARDKYTIELIKDSGKWKIYNIHDFADNLTAIYLKDNGVDIQNAETIRSYRSRIESELSLYFSEGEMTEISPAQDGDRSISAVTSTTYNGTGAASYAAQYALNYNSSYPDYSAYGGDCTNFISQCIHEGGNLPMHVGTPGNNSYWFVNSSGHSMSWTGVSSFYSYALNSSSTIQCVGSGWSSVGYGDIIQLHSSSTNSWFHSLIVSGIVYNSTGRSDLLICCHTTDRKNVSLASYFSGYGKRYLDITGSTL